MPTTYTLVFNLTGYTYGSENAYITLGTCEYSLGGSGQGDIQSFDTEIKYGLDNFFFSFGGATIESVINDEIITYTITVNDPDQLPCDGQLIGMTSTDILNNTFTGKWQETPEATICPTCQDVTMDNCGSVIFEAAIQDGTYKVRILDNQSGVFYYQNIEFTASQGIWDQTNTAGVFTPFSTYTVTILDDNGDPVSWVDGTNEYTCMRLTFATFTDTTPQG